MNCSICEKNNKNLETICKHCSAKVCKQCRNGSITYSIMNCPKCGKYTIFKIYEIKQVNKIMAIYGYM